MSISPNNGFTLFEILRIILRRGKEGEVSMGIGLKFEIKSQKILDNPYSVNLAINFFF